MVHVEITRGELLFLDTFDGVDSVEINTNNTIRQSGECVVLSWEEQFTTSASGSRPQYTQVVPEFVGSENGVLFFGAINASFLQGNHYPSGFTYGATWASPNKNFFPQNIEKFTISVDVDPVAPVTLPSAINNDDWVGITFGASAPYYPPASDGAGVILTNGGAIKLFVGNSAQVVHNAIIPNPDGMHNIRIDLITHNSTLSGPLRIDVYVDEIFQFSHEHTLGFSSNRVTLTGLSANSIVTSEGADRVFHFFDNFKLEYSSIPTNNPPLAFAGTSLDMDNRLQLDGTLSSDPDGDSLTFSWQIDGELNPRLGQIVSLADLAIGTYLVDLTVSDGTSNSNDTMIFGIPDEAGIVLPTPGELQKAVNDIKDMIISFPESSFDAPNPKSAENRRKTLLNMLDTVFNALGIEDFQAAIDQLRNLLEKTDGQEPPDSSSDWIIGADAQLVYESASNLLDDLLLHCTECN